MIHVDRLDPPDETEPRNLTILQMVHKLAKRRDSVQLDAVVRNYENRFTCLLVCFLRKH